MSKLKNWEKATQELVDEFTHKYLDRPWDSDFGGDYWIADEVGTVFCINEYYFGMEIVLYALRYNAPKDKLFDWYDYKMELEDGETPTVNFKNFIKYGLELLEDKS